MLRLLLTGNTVSIVTGATGSVFSSTLSTLTFLLLLSKELL